MADVRQLIIKSLFPGTGDDPNSPESNQAGESLVTHLKVSEDAGMTPTSTLERPGTMSRKLRYLLVTNKQRERDIFLAALLKVYKKNTNRLPKLINFDDSGVSSISDVRSPVAPSSHNGSENYGGLKDRHMNNNNIQEPQKNDRATPIPFGGPGIESSNMINNKDDDDYFKQEELSLINVSELLNDFDWKGSGNAAALEERLLNELAALEAANIHAIVESDDRVQSVIEQIDKAIAELDTMDQWFSLYSAELNIMGDADIHHIETQNRGLQVQTANQKALLSELDRLMQAITIPDQVITILRQESMDTPHGIQNIEQAAAQLKNVLETQLDNATREMKVVQEKLDLYRFHANSFCSRFYEYMRIMFQYQAETLMKDKGRSPRHNNLTIQSHDHISEHLYKYRGLSSWMKEMDPKQYLEIQSLYVTAKEPIYKKETKEYLHQMKGMLSKRELYEEATYVFSAALSHNHRTSINYGSWLSFDNTKPSWEFKDGGGGKFPPEESFDLCLRIIIPLIAREQDFMAEFFHFTKKSSFSPEEIFIKDLDAEENDDNFNTYKKLSEHMEKLFNFLTDDLSSFVDYGCKHDTVQVVGMIVSLEKNMQEYEKRGHEFVVRMLQQVRKHCLEIFDRFVNDQLRAIEETKVTSKKRKGIVLFIRIFPRFVERIEHSMNTADKLEIRRTVNKGYEKIVKTMFDCLEAIAKDAESPIDDKEQLNAHIMTLENMHHFYTEIRTRKIVVLEPFMRHARSSYDKHLEAYAKSVIRKPFGKLLEFFEGIESLLRTTAAPEEVGFRVNYNKAALKKIVSQYPGKDVKKSLEALYKRVDKHFTEEEGLLQVVWRSIEEVVIRSHDRFTSTIHRCYPDANIALEFSKDDLLGYFSELARSH